MEKTMAEYTKDELQQLQRELEGEMHGNGVARFDRNNERAVKQGAASETAWFRKLTKAFIEPLALSIDAYIDHYKGRRGKPSKSLAYLQMLPPEVSAYVAIKVIFDSLPQKGISAQMVAERIGKRIEDQVRFTLLEEAAPKYVEAIKTSLKKASSQKYEHGRTVMVHAEKKISEEVDEKYVCDLNRWIEWPKVDVVQLGSRLIDIFAENVTYLDEPIIMKDVRDLGFGKNKSVCYIVPTANIVSWVEEFKDAVSELSPCYAPCVIPPRDWSSPNSGGFHTVEVASKLPLVKVSTWGHRKRLTQKQMPSVYTAVNALQQVAWEIVPEVHKAARMVLERNLALGLPNKEPIVQRPAPIPLEFAHLRGQELKDACTSVQWDEFVEWKREAAASYDLERERRSKFAEAYRTLGQARRYGNVPELYFVYTLDFRGRVYCQSSLVSPQGSDLQKGLIRFKEAKKLGTRGKFWLAVQGANTWGEDKCTFEERVTFIEGMEDEIRDIAANPIQFRTWAGADKPWQFLSFCYEWAALCDHEESGNAASSFASRLPIAQDGSCSGIQHYSAMLRDPIGGAAVNLVPSKAPQDIYGEVARVTTIKVQEALTGAETIPEKRIAQAWLDVGITRGQTKKSVMTLPYGSSQQTCRQSMGQYLDDLQAKELEKAKAEERRAVKAHPFSNEKGKGINRFDAERMISSHVWSSISDVVVAARAGMKYIKDVTGVVAKANMNLEWITPTGFIVQQNIFKMKKNRIKTQLMGTTDFTLLEPTEDIDPVRMKSACAPNFVHSMDASHLVMAVQRAHSSGISSIAVVHDSFGCHACDTDSFRQMLLDTLVELYKDNDVLTDFKEHNELRLLQAIGVDVPEPLGLDIEVIRDSRYCFG
jgi:DNA-directed RNA polymerase